MLRKVFLLVLVSLLVTGSAIAQGGSTSSSDGSKSSAEEKAPAFRPTKDQVMQGQKFLKEQKLYNGEATGIYNDDTRGAIKQYQKSNSLAVNGKFDRATLDKMGIALTDKQKGTAAVTSTKSTATDARSDATKTTQTTETAGPKRPAPFQATKEQIMELQKTLKSAKLFTGEADGERSDALKEAVTNYQKANGLKATGGINAATLEKMGIALTAKQKEQVAAQAAYDAAKASSKEQ